MRDMMRWTRVFSCILAASMIMGSAATLYAEEVTEPVATESYDAAAEQAAAEEAERIAAEQAAAEEAARIAAEQAEAERIAAEQAEAERIAAEQAAKAEEERLAAEQAEAERIAAEQAAKAEEERLAAEKAEAERIAKELAEADRFLADLENEEDWVRTLPTELRHKTAQEPKEDDYRADIVDIANSQRGYKESEINYIELEDGTKSPYTRYGQWFNDPYANPWDAEFACFVLYYAGVPEVPFDGDTAAWTHKLSEKEMYFASDYESPEAEDLIFLTEDDGFFHVGIITGFDTDENGAERIVYVEGTISGERREVTESKIYKGDHRISAFGVVVPQDPETEELIDIEDDGEVPLAAGPEDAAEGEGEADNAEGGNEVFKTEDTVDIDDAEVPLAEPEKPVLPYQTADAGVYTDDTKATVLENTSITVRGCLPENAEVTAWPVQVEVDGEETFAAFQIQILDADGNEFHSTAGDGYEYAVTIQNEQLSQMLENSSNAHGWHQGSGEEKTDLSYTLPGDGTVQFTADEI